MSVNVRSAEGEPWWPDFVRDYGAVPLRELARRYETNPRRLRRAAQRAGLTSEPEELKAVLDRLGKAPDAALAEQAGVTTEVIAGARRRRDIPAFVREPAPSPSEDPAVVRSKGDRSPRGKGPTESDAVVVVRRTSGPAPAEPTFSRQAPRLPTAPAAPEVVERRPRRRRRIVVQDARPEPEPLPEPPAKRRKPRRERLHSEVRVIAVNAERPTPSEPKRRSAPEPEPVAAVAPEPVVASEPEPVVTSEPEPVVAPEPVAEPEPVAAPPTPELEDNGSQLWWARVLTDGEEQEVVVEATDLSSAAALARTKGEVLRLELARQL